MRRLIVIAALGVLVAGCSEREQVEWRNGPPPTCDTTSRGRLLLIAQSVPEASLIPCIGPLPQGWEFVRATSQTSQSVLLFTNDAVDLETEVRLTPACEPDGPRIEADRASAAGFTADDGAAVVFVFDGGCITFAFETAALASSAIGRDLIDAIPFMTRDHLRAVSGWTL